MHIKKNSLLHSEKRTNLILHVLDVVIHAQCCIPYEFMNITMFRFFYFCDRMKKIFVSLFIYIFVNKTKKNIIREKSNNGKTARDLNQVIEYKL